MGILSYSLLEKWTELYYWHILININNSKDILNAYCETLLKTFYTTFIKWFTKIKQIYKHQGHSSLCLVLSGRMRACFFSECLYDLQLACWKVESFGI